MDWFRAKRNVLLDMGDISNNICEWEKEMKIAAGIVGLM